MWPGPVFHVELLRLARQPRYFLLRFVYGSIILFFLGLVSNSFSNLFWLEGREATIHDLANLGQSMLAVLAWTQSIALLVLTPALVAGVIADERQRKTLDYLLASALTRPEIVLGKLFARLTHLGVFLAIGLPIMAITTFFGGIDPNVIILFFVASASVAIFLGALSIAVSSTVLKPRDAISIAYSLEFCWLFVPAIVAALLPSPASRGVIWEGVDWINQLFAAISPFFLLTNAWSVSSSQMMTNFFTMIGGQLVASVLLVGIAIVNVRPVAGKEGSSTSLWKRFKTKRSIALFKRPECYEDAMLWKEIHCSRKSFGHQLLMTVLFVGFGFLVLYSLSFLIAPAFEEFTQYGYNVADGYGRRRELNFALKFVMSAGYVVAALSIAAAAANSFTSEREQDTWISLLTSPLTAREMIRAKALASVLSAKWILAYLYGLLLLGLLLGAIHPLGLLLNVVVTSIHLAFVTALGIYFSLRSRTSTRAMSFTIGLLLAFNLGAVLIAAIWERDGGEFFLFGFSPIVEYASILTPNSLDFFHDLGPAMINASRIAIPVFIFGHLLATVVLFGRCYHRFDEWNDRPRTVS